MDLSRVVVDRVFRGATRFKRTDAACDSHAKAGGEPRVTKQPGTDAGASQIHGSDEGHGREPLRVPAQFVYGIRRRLQLWHSTNRGRRRAVYREPLVRSDYL